MGLDLIMLVGAMRRLKMRVEYGVGRYCSVNYESLQEDGLNMAEATTAATFDYLAVVLSFDIQEVPEAAEVEKEG